MEKTNGIHCWVFTKNCCCGKLPAAAENFQLLRKTLQLLRKTPSCCGKLPAAAENSPAAAEKSQLLRKSPSCCGKLSSCCGKLPACCGKLLACWKSKLFRCTTCISAGNQNCFGARRASALEIKTATHPTSTRSAAITNLSFAGRLMATVTTVETLRSLPAGRSACLSTSREVQATVTTATSPMI